MKERMRSASLSRQRRDVYQAKQVVRGGNIEEERTIGKRQTMKVFACRPVSSNRSSRSANDVERYATVWHSDDRLGDNHVIVTNRRKLLDSP